MAKYDYSTYCNEALFESFPELLDFSKYKEIIAEACEDYQYSAHSIYEQVLCDYILSILEKKDSLSRSSLKKAFELIEELVQHENFEVRCVAKVSFIEPFLDKVNPTRGVQKYLKPASLKAAQEIAAQRFGLNPITWEKDED
ncbi:DUF7674 family protein [Candidatus Odyssella thessalonicensis]|uniref:DUF7674 family protein n=1 Tax=Candidatus Odyssella thessalonicensis TaxID=84647 RepID=UPI000225AF9D|nr:hypothetical protein [Candidatus Odyssella thessalonicensis]